jgi:two-component system chemotaxis response regulator CheY
MAKPLANEKRPIVDLADIQFLLVDDNPYMRNLVRGLLRSFGARKFLEAEDGISALAIIDAQKIDIILSNWEMRPMDGLDMVRRLRRHPIPEKQMLPVIMMTSHSSLDNVTTARDSGINEFLAKPIAPNELYLRIETIILHPRDFIRDRSYFGPDRHRRNDANYRGPRRRRAEHSAP